MAEKPKGRKKKKQRADKEAEGINQNHQWRMFKTNAITMWERISKES